MFKLLSLDHKEVLNIGDYIQALADAQFFPHLDGFVNRERLDEYDGDECNVIMNGWFMHEPKHWPPSPKINPFFVAFHINSSAKDFMLSDDGVAYLKKYMPIGCRDLYTVSLLKEKGIDAFLSGCMTLTLGENYSSKEKDDKCYFVDPYIKIQRSLKNIIKCTFYLIFSLKSSIIITKKMFHHLSFSKMLVSANFFHMYSKFFSKKMLLNSEYICQESSYYATNFKSDFDRLAEAERLVKLYARAKLVVTSRIHCALPCLGLETPVIYTKRKNDEEISSCRFGGLIDLFNVIVGDENGFNSCFEYDGKFIDSSKITNPTKWKKLRDNLKKQVENFVNTCTK